MVINTEREVTKIYKREKMENRDRNIKQGPHMEEKQTDRKTNPCHRKTNWVLKG